MLRALLYILGITLFLWLTLRWLEPRLVFHPMQNWEMDLTFMLPPAEEVQFHSEDGVLLSGIWFSAADPKGVLLYCHGNAGNLSHRSHVVEVWRDQLGYSVFLFDYRGFGRSEGSPSEQGIYLDGIAAYEQVLLLGGGEVPVIAGRSLGTVVATRLASIRKARGLILDSPLASAAAMAKEMFGLPGVSFFMRYQLNNVETISKVQCPVLILHGDNDNLIPIGQARTVFDSVQSRKEFLVLEGQGHNEPRGEPEVVQRLEEFVKGL